MYSFFFFFNDTATTEIYTLSYTTLFRSRLWAEGVDTLDAFAASPHIAGFSPERKRALSDEAVRAVRSEEHTSELQSRRDLVCRLLLEKKKRLTSYLTDVSNNVR